jgi:hypothetical protein
VILRTERMKMINGFRIEPRLTLLVMFGSLLPHGVPL